MSEPDSRRERTTPGEKPEYGNPISPNLQSEQHDGAEGKKPTYCGEHPEDDLDEEFRAFWEWLVSKFKDAKLIDLAQIVTGAVLVVIGIIAACIYWGQLNQMTIATSATRSAAETAARELELSERPWLSARFIITGPLVIDREGAHLPMQVVLNNFGRSPAVKGADEIKFYASFLLHPDPRNVRRDLCEEVKGVSAQPLNSRRQFLKTWFPGEQPPTQYRLSISRGEINKAMINIPNSLFPDYPTADRVFWIEIAYCVAYRSSFGAAEYHTGYSFDVVPQKGSSSFGPQFGSFPVMSNFDFGVPTTDAN